jgi:hypothetical protein
MMLETEDFLMDADWCIFRVGEFSRFGFLTFFRYRRFSSPPPEMWLMTPWIGVPSSSYNRRIRSKSPPVKKKSSGIAKYNEL